MDVLKDALVMVRTRAAAQSTNQPSSEKRLVAYIVAQDGLVANEADGKQLIADIRNHLHSKFPDHMVPNALVIMDELPLNANGKVERRLLPEPQDDSVEASEYLPPSTSTEQMLCQIWQDALSLEQVGVNDNFFSLGGDSINSIRVVAQIKKQGFAIAVKDLFNHQSVRQLAEFIDNHAGQAVEAINIAPFSLLTKDELDILGGDYLTRLDDAYPMSQLQLGMVFHSKVAGPGMYHDVFNYHIQLFWKPEAFEQALSHMIAQHPVLRSGYVFDGERPIQQIYKSIDLPLEVVDICDLSQSKQEAYIADWVKQQQIEGFQWQGPLFKILLCRRSENSFEFGLSFHHAVYDGWSNSLFISQLMLHYQALANGKALPQPFNDSAFRDFIALEQQALADPQAKAFWTDMLSEATIDQIPRRDTEFKELNADASNAEQESNPSVFHQVEGFSKLSGQIIQLSKTLGVPLQSVLLAAHAKVLSLLSSQPNALTTVVVNGRPENEGGELGLGLFLNSLPVCFDTQSDSYAQLIKDTSATMADAMKYRNYPLSAISRDTGQEFGQVIFNYTHFRAYDQLAQGSDQQAQLLGSDSSGETNFDYNVNFSRSVGSDELTFTIIYNDEVYDNELIARIDGYFINVFEQMLADIEQSHYRCLLPQAEQDILFKQFNAEVDNQLPFNSICELFEHSAVKFADRTALVEGQQRLTYQQVNKKANQLAHYLQTPRSGS